MATFFFAWELGGGLGHVLPFRPVAQALIAKGHRVVAALRDQTHAVRAFGDLPIRCLPAPHKSWRTDDRIEPLLTFAHILHNTGWSRVDDLKKLTAAWRTVLDDVRPDVVICDHSPTMLLALRGRGIKHATFGTGFFCPPDRTPLPNLSLFVNGNPIKLRRDESHVFQVANEVLCASGQPTLLHLTQLYAEADDRVLTTFAELDHYPERKPGRYSGWWPTGAGRPFDWPAGHGPKVYAYLKDFPALIDVVKFLREQAWPTVIFAPGLLDKLRPFASASLALTDVPLDLQQVASEADLAIQNANHGTLAELLLAGKPVLSIPITLEQAILARRVAELGAGMTAWGNYAADVVRTITVMLDSDRYEIAARRFAERYAGFDPKKALAGVVERIERLVRFELGSDEAGLTRPAIHEFTG